MDACHLAIHDQSIFDDCGCDMAGLTCNGPGIASQPECSDSNGADFFYRGEFQSSRMNLTNTAIICYSCPDLIVLGEVLDIAQYVIFSGML